MEFIYCVSQTSSVKKSCILLTLFPIFLAPFLHLLESHPQGNKKADEHQQPESTQAIVK